MKNKKFLIENAQVSEDNGEAVFKPTHMVPCTPKYIEQNINLYLTNKFDKVIAEATVPIFFGFLQLSPSADPKRYFFDAQELT